MIASCSSTGVKLKLSTLGSSTPTLVPRSLSALESTIVTEVKSALKRGKIDISFDLNPQSRGAIPTLNEDALKHFKV